MNTLIYSLQRVVLSVFVLLILSAYQAIGGKVVEVITEGVDGSNTVFMVANSEIAYPITVSADLTDDGVSNPIPMESIHDETDTGVEWSALNELMTVQVSDSLTKGHYPQVAVDSEGFIHVVWSGSYAVYYSCNREGAFIPETVVSKDFYYAFANLRIVIDGKDNIFIIWTNYNGAYLVQRETEGFSSPERIFGVDHEITNLKVACDSRGTIHLVFIEVSGGGDIRRLQHAHNSSGSFSLTALDEYTYAANFKIDHFNRAHLVWKGKVDWTDAVLYTVGIGGEFGETISVYTDFTGPTTPPRLDLDGFGRVHILWASDVRRLVTSDTEGRYSPAYATLKGDRLTDPIEFTDDVVLSSRDLCSDLEIDGYGNAHLVWYSDSGVCLSIVAPDLTFSPARVIIVRDAVGCRDLDVILDVRNVLHIFWVETQWDGTESLWYAKDPWGVFIEPAVLAIEPYRDECNLAFEENNQVLCAVWDDRDAHIHIAVPSATGNEVKFHRDNRTLTFESPPVAGSAITVESFTEFLPAQEVYAYPNPAEGHKTTIRCFLKEPAHLEIGIYDLAYDLVSHFETSGVGLIEFDWYIQGLASGVYLYRVEATILEGRSEVVEKKIMVVR